MKNILIRSRLLVLAAGLLLTAPALWSCNSETASQRQIREHDEQMRIIDEDTIHHYLQRNQLVNQSTRTSSGLYLVTLAQGTGTAITAGRQVSVKYTGKLLSNGAHPESYSYPASPGDARFPAGTVFDNSADKNPGCGCAVFTQGTTVPGFNEGLLLMRKGDRKLLLIPSRLGYGPTGVSGSVPPDSALLFDVEVLDVY